MLRLLASWKTWIFACACVAVILGPKVHGAGAQNISVNANPTFVQAVQLTNDTNLDLVVGTINDIRLSIGAANGSFSSIIVPATNVVGGASVLNAAAGALNTDGRVDLVVGSSDSLTTITILFDYDTVGANFQSSTTLTTGTAFDPHYVAVADLDGDGLADIITSNPSSNSVVVFRRTGNGTFAAAQNLSVPNPSAIAIGDFNGDGKADIVTTSSSTNGVGLLQNLSTAGAITFGNARTVAVGTTPSFVELKDIDGDSKLDLLVLVSGAMNVLRGNGDGSFQNAVSNPVISGSQNFVVGDLSGDGVQDVTLVTNLGTNVPSIFLLKGNGNGTFNAATEFQVNGIATSATVGDFNKDGQLDVASTFGSFGASTPTVTVRLLDKRPTLTSLSPATGLIQPTTGPGVTLTISGTGFIAGNTRVDFAGTTLVPTTSTTTSVTVTIPASLLGVAGRVDLTVTNVDGTGSGIASAPLPFSLYASTIGTITVTTTTDSGAGSLRAALQNARNGDTITFDQPLFDLINSDAATVINVLSELPPLDDGNVILDAQNQRVTVNGSGAGSAAGLVITSGSNIVRGLTLVGFAQSGIRIRGGAKSNVIGGNRSLGKSPNGQGLRISNCGAFGIEITGAGTDGNSVRGCWIGLDSSGIAPQANLAGILIQDTAKTNTVGGTSSGEANAVSGNDFEGVTLSGAGSDGNTVLGNVVGAAAVLTLESTVTKAASREDAPIPTRASAGNGSAGVFLSKGTQSSRVGGEGSGEGNIVSFNGGNGIEVRAGTSQKNKATSNSITGNVRGGIALFDGSNAGVTPPTDDGITVVSIPSNGVRRVRIRGNSTRDGTIEVFNDTGEQGGTILGRAGVSGGRFDIQVDTKDLNKLTATLTDANGNTSPFKTLASPLITTTGSAAGVINTTFSFAITATNSPQSYSATGLPAGLSVNTTTGVISGQPTTEGVSSVALTAANATGTGTATLLITVTATAVTPEGSAPVITSAATATGVVNTNFSYQITAGSGISTYNATGLPSGLQINTSTGAIGGIPTVTGAFTVNLSATNAAGTGTAALTLRIAQAGDSDFDGVLDVQEELVGSDKNSASDTPASGGVVIADKISATVNFTSTTKDSLKTTLLLFLPQGFVTSAADVNIRFGDLVEPFKLDLKGKSPKAPATLSLKGGSAVAGPAKAGALTFSVKGKSLRTALASAGITDRTTSGDNLKIPVSVGIMVAGKKTVYSGEAAVLYKATQGKSGKVAKAK